MTERLRWIVKLVLYMTLLDAVVACIRYLIWRGTIGDLLLGVTWGIIPSLLFAILMSGEEKPP